MEPKKNIKRVLNEKTRVAVVHDWIFERRGGEKVLERILNLFPQADLYYLFGNPEDVLVLEKKPRFFPSFLNKIPFISRLYKFLLPLLPVAIESFDFSSYELIVSTSSCVAKGVIPSPNAVHVSYIHSPMRYAWDQEHRYFKKPPALFRPIEILRRILLSRLRVWDVTSSVRVDKMIANSHFVARRCQLYYGKNADTIYPPVNIDMFEKIYQNARKTARHRPISLNSKGGEMEQKREAFLRDNNEERPVSNKVRKVMLFGAWVPYKQMYEALELLIANKIPVIAVGMGEELNRAQKKYGHLKDLVEFHLQPDDDDLPYIFEKAHTLLFPAIEDFGIVPLEATSSGLWVVSPNKGGTVETVLNHVTGFSFQEGDAEDMLATVRHSLEREIFEEDLDEMLNHVRQFSPEVFDVTLLSAVGAAYHKSA